MSFRRFLSLVLALVLASAVSACASSGSGASGGGGDTQQFTGGNSTLIVRAQLAQYSGRNALEAVQQFNRRWLQPQRTSSFDRVFARVVIDNGPPDVLETLGRLSVDSIESMRFLSAIDATTRYGTGNAGGIIVVTSRGR